LRQYAQTHRFRNGRPEHVAVPPERDVALFLRSGPRDLVRDLWELNLATGTERVVLRAQDLLGGAEEELSVEEKARRERQRRVARGISSFSLSKDGARVLVPLSGRLFVYERSSAAVRELKGPQSSSPQPHPVDARFSPQGDRVALVLDCDLYVFDLASGVRRRLTTRPGPQVEHGLAEFVAQEEMDRMRGYWWAPDGQSLLVQQTDLSPVDRLHLSDPFHPDRKPSARAYPRAGRPNARVRVGRIPVQGGPPLWLRWDQGRFPYLAAVRWGKEGPATLLVQNRAQTELQLLEVLDNGRTRSLLVERDAAWVNIPHKVPLWLKGGETFLWVSESRGRLQLEQRARDGKLLAPLSEPDFGLRALLGVEPGGRWAWTLASPRGPLDQGLYRVPLQGGAPVALGPEQGWTEATLSQDAGLAICEEQAQGQLPRTLLRDGAGKQLGLLRSRAERPSWSPRVELTQVEARPGVTLHAALLRPRSFEEGRRYPVILYTYGGPGLQVVTRTPRRLFLHQWIADHGFVVVALDGRGTPGRGRDWERAIKGKLGSVPLDDQVAGLRALLKRYPELDRTRVGIYGWSFGGYLAAYALARQGELFRAGVAVAPVTDWAAYDSHYTERYMGLPERAQQAYRDASVLTWAPDLKRPLLLVHGLLDDNVYSVHSLKLNEALFLAGSNHRFLPLASLTHISHEALVTERLFGALVGHFQQHLGGPR